MCVLTHRDHDNLHKLILSYHVDPWDWNQVTSLEKQELLPIGPFHWPKIQHIYKTKQTKTEDKTASGKISEAKKNKNRKADLFFQMNIWAYDIKQQCVNCCTRSNKSHAVLEAHTCYIVILFSSEKRSSKSSWGPLKARQLRNTVLKLGLQTLCTTC